MEVLNYVLIYVSLIAAVVSIVCLFGCVYYMVKMNNLYKRIKQAHIESMRVFDPKAEHSAFNPNEK